MARANTNTKMRPIDAYGTFLVQRPYAGALIFACILAVHVALICSANITQIPLITDVNAVRPMHRHE